jgi:hypothetical protein
MTVVVIDSGNSACHIITTIAAGRVEKPEPVEVLSLSLSPSSLSRFTLTSLFLPLLRFYLLSLFPLLFLSASLSSLSLSSSTIPLLSSLSYTHTHTHTHTISLHSFPHRQMIPHTTSRADRTLDKVRTP